MWTLLEGRKALHLDWEAYWIKVFNFPFIPLEFKNWKVFIIWVRRQLSFLRVKLLSIAGKLIQWRARLETMPDTWDFKLHRLQGKFFIFVLKFFDFKQAHCGRKLNLQPLNSQRDLEEFLARRYRPLYPGAFRKSRTGVVCCFFSVVSAITGTLGRETHYWGARETLPLYHSCQQFLKCLANS